MPSVSIVIPTHDRRELALSTIRSALAQRGVDVEVIVVDDASSDETDEAVRSLSEPAVRLLRHDDRSGVATARNTGIAAANADWIALLDDDDLWSPNKIRAQLDAAVAARSDWVYAGVVEIDGDGRYLGGLPPPSPDTPVATIGKRNLMPAGCSNVMIRSRLLDRTGGFEPGLRHLADWDLWLRLVRYATPTCVSEPLVAYRVHPLQASMDTTGMLDEAAMLEDRHGADRASVLRWQAWSSLRQGRRWDAIRTYANAAVSGDVLSLGRAVVAALHPSPTSLRRTRATPVAADWRRRAESWLPRAS